MLEEPLGLIDGKIQMNKSYMFSDICPVDKSELRITHKVYDEQMENLLRTNVQCPRCGRTGVIFNE